MDIYAILCHRWSTVLIQDVLYVLLSLYLKCGANVNCYINVKFIVKYNLIFLSQEVFHLLLLRVTLASCYSLLCKSLSVAGLNTQLWDFPKKWE